MVPLFGYPYCQEYEIMSWTTSWIESINYVIAIKIVHAAGNENIVISWDWKAEKSPCTVFQVKISENITASLGIWKRQIPNKTEPTGAMVNRLFGEVFWSFIVCVQKSKTNRPSTNNYTCFFLVMIWCWGDLIRIQHLLMLVKLWHSFRKRRQCRNPMVSIIALFCRIFYHYSYISKPCMR